jgi:hypothetical protein
MPSRCAAASLLPAASASACRIVSRSARASEASLCRVGDDRYSGGRCAWVMSDPIDWTAAEVSTASSSRTLPGQSCPVSVCKVDG